MLLFDNPQLWHVLCFLFAAYNFSVAVHSSSFSDVLDSREEATLLCISAGCE